MTPNSPYCFTLPDAVLLPYKVSSGSGVMFDALAHGLPFIASDLEFFREFASMGLGITVKRHAKAFEKSLLELGANYPVYLKAVESFKNKLKWDYIANMHNQLYEAIMKDTSSRMLQRRAKAQIGDPMDFVYSCLWFSNSNLSIQQSVLWYVSLFSVVNFN